ncbi:CsbD family protein [Spirulina sp. CCNP1310]|uniref:CsbD family protein n=1 Tax=Spirulina sp. CCNP1310 TaxID=3110249 RepID=UPI002B2180EC|nr:CsbD family protein [Spirulina sp. CCNP1310]MEA5418637.1 CsbD family protein [Spirulina sp. CCNP1310]
MTSLRKTIHLLISFGLMFFISTASGFTARNASATPLLTVTLGQVAPGSGPLAWGFGDAQATAKDLEGKAQELVGNVTGDPKDQLMGQAKQAESQLRHDAQNAKDMEAKLLEETMGNITSDVNNAEDQIMGKVKQVENHFNSTVENVKSAAENLIN